MNIFISYRRADGNLQALLLHKELVQRLPEHHVFMDVSDIGWGDDFAQKIGLELARVDVLIVIIGAQWLRLLEERQRGDDWVRYEVTHALALRAQSLQAGGKERPRVLPLLVDPAAQPLAARTLPGALAPLADLHAKRFDERESERSLDAIVEAVRGKTFRQEHDDVQERRESRYAALAVGLVLALASLSSLLDLLNLDTAARQVTLALASMGRSEAERPWSDKVVFVAIDKASEAQVGRPHDSTWRPLHARVIDIAREAGARSLVFDIFFDVAARAEDDVALERALSNAKPTLPVALAVSEMDRAGKPKLAPRLGELATVAIACAGKPGQVVTSMPLALERGGAKKESVTQPNHERLWLPSLALAAWSGNGRILEPTDQWSGLLVSESDPVALGAGGVKPPQRGRTVDFPVFQHSDIERPQNDCSIAALGDRVALQWLDPYALPALTAPPRRVSYHAVLQRETVAMQALAGRVVLVGVDLEEDRFALWGQRNFRAGSELIVGQIDALERQAQGSGAMARPPGPLAQAVLYGTLALLGGRGGAFMLRRWPWWRNRALLVACVGVALATVLLYRWTSWLVPLPYAVLALLAGGAKVPGLGLRAWRRARQVGKA
jgi:CHASE2 domain-containing sensor protein